FAELFPNTHGVTRPPGGSAQPRVAGPPEAPVTDGIYYKTGDLARWQPDGNIEFLGRIDQQFKIRGFRIELGEIEACLLTHPEIKEAVVIVRESTNGDKSLCAYYVGISAQQPERDLKNYLLKYLPGYMVPAFFLKLPQLPLTPNGKIDRKALPEPEMKTGSDYEAPAGPVEETLTEVWQQILNHDGIGVNDNYFNLGGDSIKTIQIASRLRTYDLKLEIKDQFTHQTIKQLAPHVKKISRKSQQGTVEGTVPLTPIQQWFFRASLTRAAHFNQSVMISRGEGFDETILKKVFTKIIHHHDALRMVYEDTSITDMKNKNRGDDGPTLIQRNRGTEGELYHFNVFDFKHLAEEDIKTRIPMEATR
ncbi:MAG: AMP-binding protein, partial [bacterium]|nr:AMP-binding protein [bacterium]